MLTDFYQTSCQVSYFNAPHLTGGSLQQTLLVDAIMPFNLPIHDVVGQGSMSPRYIRHTYEGQSFPLLADRLRMLHRFQSCWAR